MSKELEEEDSFVVDTEMDLVESIKKIQQQLNSLEKKIDSLISRGQENSFKEKSFSKPFRSFGGQNYRSRDSHSDYRQGSRDRSYENRDSYYGKGETYGSRTNRGGNAGYGHSFSKKHYGGQRSGNDDRGEFVHKKKTFPYKRKDRN